MNKSVYNLHILSAVSGGQSYDVGSGV